MTAISSIETEEPIDLYKEPLNPNCQKVAAAALIVFSFIAACAFIPSCLKKKRITTTSLITPYIHAPEAVEAENPQLDVPRCNPTDRAKVEEIFHTVANEKLYKLAYPWVAYRLITLGNEIDPIHPFSFLLAAPKEQVKQIFTSGSDFKIKNVMSGIIKGMNREKAKNNLNRYIPGFAAAMDKEAEPTRPFIQVGDWRGLVDYLYDL